MKSYYFGIIAEYVICAWYLIKFYKVIGYRVKTKLGEIDIICVRKKTIVFVEVKARSSKNDEILCKIKQQQRVRNAAILFLQRNKKYSHYDIRFDLCIIRPYKWPEIIKNAW